MNGPALRARDPEAAGHSRVRIDGTSSTKRTDTDAPIPAPRPDADRFERHSLVDGTSLDKTISVAGSHDPSTAVGRAARTRHGGWALETPPRHQSGGLTPTEHQISDRADRLHEAHQSPPSFGTTHQRFRSSCKVDQGHRSQCELYRRRDDDRSASSSTQLFPSWISLHTLDLTDGDATSPALCTAPKRDSSASRCSAENRRVGEPSGMCLCGVSYRPGVMAWC
jgi:hypothetical protein